MVAFNCKNIIIILDSAYDFGRSNFMHLTKDDRYTIENNLNNNISLKQIGKIINKHCSNISREIRNHYITKNII